MLSKIKDIKKIVRENCQFKAQISEFSQKFQVIGNSEDIKNLYSTLTDMGLQCSLSNKYVRILYRQITA